MTFSPKTAIVTGSDSGIGRATAVALARAGLDVGITYNTDQEGAEATAEEVRQTGQKAVVVHFDASEGEACVSALDELISELGGIDVFVNNAGTGDDALIVDMTYDQWRHTVATDLDGAFLGIRRTAKQMIEQGNGGRIIGITSVHEHQPRVGASAYDAAKHGMGGLIKTAALELGQHGITVNAVAPGEIATPMTGRWTRTRAAPSAPAFRSGVPATRGRSRRLSRSSPRPPRAT